MDRDIVYEREYMAKQKEWALLLEQERELGVELSLVSEQFERIRKENIGKRYLILIEALATGYANKQTLQYIAELGAEFGANKAYEYLGGSPFSKSKIRSIK